MIDVHVTLSRWPSRRLPDDETGKLVAKLKANNIDQAWASSFDGLLHNDISSVNAALSRECAESGRGILRPFGVINPSLPGWQDDLARCVHEHKMSGIRIYPNYHGYELDDPRAVELFGLCQLHRCLVQVVVGVEDERTQHRLLRVPSVDLRPLQRLLPKLSELPFILLNSQRSTRPDQLAEVVAAGLVFVDIACQEGVGGVSQLLKVIPAERVLLGSNAPFFYLESSLLKLRESELPNFQLEAIVSRNAERLMKGRS